MELRVEIKPSVSVDTAVTKRELCSFGRRPILEVVWPVIHKELTLSPNGRSGDHEQCL